MPVNRKVHYSTIFVTCVSLTPTLQTSDTVTSHFWSDVFGQFTALKGQVKVK